MRIPTLLLTAAFFCSCIVSCSAKKEAPATPAPVQAPVLTALEKVPFSAPADSLVAPARMKAWLDCNGQLDSLSIRYIDLFKTDNPEKRLAYQKDFDIEQDNICIRAGLKSGYAEYVWLLRTCGIPKNRHILDSLTVGSN